MWIVGLSRFVIVVVLRCLLKDEPELQLDEEGLVARALGGFVIGAGGAQEEQAERCRCACQPLQTHILHTFSFFFVSA